MNGLNPKEEEISKAEPTNYDEEAHWPQGDKVNGNPHHQVGKDQDLPLLPPTNTTRTLIFSDIDLIEPGIFQPMTKAFGTAGKEPGGE